MTYKPFDDKPTPGSKEAVDTGCICPVYDNHYGRGYGGEGEKYGWCVNGECPLHAIKDDAVITRESDRTQ